MKTLTATDVVAIHEGVILPNEFKDPNELQGMASHKSIEAILARIDNRLAYGMIDDVYMLAACYACYISVGHAFHDANKRTAFASMDICLAINAIELEYETTETGNLIVKAAQGIVDEDELAKWLRSLNAG